jgi:molybdate transport system substrate-binding protein
VKKYFLLFGLLSFSLFAYGQALSVAVAANFTAPMQKIAPLFEQATGYKLKLSFGATGVFYTQIANGAPFEVLLAADDETPIKLQNEGLAVAATRMTYAQGSLVLWTKRKLTPQALENQLRQGDFEHLAVANAKLAPYGLAAQQALQKMNLWASVQGKLVEGTNIAQTYQFVLSENAPLGFVALSQVYADGKITDGTGWVVPAGLYDPIRQDAIVLSKGKDNPASAALLQFLRSDAARGIMASYGYTF